MMDMSDLERAEGAFLRVAARPNRHDSGVRYLEEQFVAVRASERAKFESVEQPPPEQPDLSSHQAHMDWMRRARSVAAGPFKTPKDRRTMDSDHEEILLAIKGLKEGEAIDRLDTSAALSARMQREMKAALAAGDRMVAGSKEISPSPELRKAKDELTDDEASELSRVLERERRRVERQERIAEAGGYVQVEPLQKPVPYETTVAVEEDGAVNWQMPPPEPEAPFMEGLAVALENHAEQLEEEVLSLDSLLARLGTAARLPRKAPLPERSEIRADSLFVRLGALRWRIDAALSDLRTLVVIFEKEVG